MSLFVEGSYEVLEFSMPPNGMNQNISPKILPPNFAHVLENILPIPQGRGMVRYGTSLINNQLPPDSNILEQFEFITSNGNKQIVAYVSQFKEDLTVSNINVSSVTTFNFDSTSPTKFVIESGIKLRYSGGFGITTLYSTIKSVNISGNTVTLTLDGDNIFPPNFDTVTINNIYYSDGNIYSYDIDTNVLSASLINGLSVTTVPRHEIIQNTLIICNGVNPLMSWDGTNLNIIVDYIKELANAFNWIDATHFSFTIPANFIISKYQNNAPIRISINGNLTNTTVSAITVVNNIATITTADNVPQFAGRDVVILFYTDKPPPFSYLFVAHDRMFALAPGAVGIEYRSPEEAMRVYYANQTNSYTNWFDERTKQVLYEDLSNKHGVVDNLEAICLVNNLMMFIGRNKTQAWQGYDPTPNAAPATQFQWAYNLPIGIAHGNLLVELANDVGIITPNGFINFSKFNIAQQVVASAYDAIDPIIREYVQTITDSNIEYRKCRSFKYPSGPFCGFKIGNNKLLVSLYSTNLYAWSFFSGDFSNAQCFCSVGNSLYMGIGNKIYKYADGKDASPVLYGDQNGTAIISFYWTLPVVHKPGRRFANKRYEIEIDYPSGFFINPQNEIWMEVYGDLRKTFSIEDKYTLSIRGDPFGTIPLLPTSDDPNNPPKDAIGMRFGIPYEIIKDRLKFISSSFWLNIRGYCINGPLYFDQVRLFGIFERNS